MLDKAFKVVQKSIQTIVSNISGPSGSKIAINNKTYIEEKLIAEGAFGYIYLVTDPLSSTQYALKRINISNKTQLKSIKSEIDIWTKINNGKFIIKLIDYEITPTAAFILMEHAHEGTLLDYITKRTKTLTENETLNIIYQITCGLSHMHKQSPPIAHRDIKIENILKCGSMFKLCDFGSASTFVLDPSKEDKKVVQMQFALFEKNCTFNYRPPEMCDVYSNAIVNEKVDIWALGCIMYSMLFKTHPFADAQKLTIISGQYVIPEYSENYSEKLIDLMRLMLTPNPELRPSCVRLIEIMKRWKEVKEIELSDEVMKIKEIQKNTVNRPEVDQFFFSNNQSEGESKVNSSQVTNSNNSNKQQEVWDFDFGNTTTTTTTNTMQSKVQSNEGNNNSNSNNMLDFEFFDNTQAFNDFNIGTNTNTNTNTDIKTNEKEKQGQMNLLDDFAFDTITTNSNVNKQSDMSNTQDNKSNTDIFGFDFDVKSKPEPVFTTHNNTNTKVNQQIHFNPNFQSNSLNKPNNPNDNKNKQKDNNQSSGQDILSFF